MKYKFINFTNKDNNLAKFILVTQIKLRVTYTRIFTPIRLLAIEIKKCFKLFSYTIMIIEIVDLD